jgi:hypothetical protein
MAEGEKKCEREWLERERGRNRESNRERFKEGIERE